jgi:energy-converting hydrogenase Eha subunit G
VQFDVSIDTIKHAVVQLVDAKLTSLLTLLLSGKSNPITGLDRPRVFQEDESPRFQDNLHMKVIKFTPQEIFLILISVGTRGSAVG